MFTISQVNFAHAPRAAAKAREPEGRNDRLSLRPIQRPAIPEPNQHNPFPDVSVWYVQHGAGQKTEGYYSILTETDFAEFASIRHIATRDRSLATRALLRKALSEVTSDRTQATEWTFERGEHGKPLLGSAHPQLHFSCSHTPWMSAVAVSRTHPVGIDIECAQPRSDEDLTDDYFTSCERMALSRLPVHTRAQARARLWALKEATVKMLGTGLAYDISELEFDPVQDRLNSSREGFSRLSEMRIATWSIRNETQPLSVALAVGV